MNQETMAPRFGMPQDVVHVTEFTDGLVGPSQAMLGPVCDGGRIVTRTPPGCWSPMITPSFHGGHEVTRPVAVAGADIGDAIVLRLLKVRAASDASSSGVDSFVDGRYDGDPFVAKKCANCGAASPGSYLEGVGEDAVRCKECGAEANAFRFVQGYTCVLDRENNVGVTVPPEVARKVGAASDKFHASPENTHAHSILRLAAGELPGLITRMAPFMGNIGTSPSADMPDSHNAGDFGAFLIGAPHAYAMSRDELHQHKTDGHMDCAQVREGSVLICPVKVPGAGVYMGDMHAMQGNGEVAGHATDVTADVEVQVEVIKGLALDGPILLPLAEDLPPLARPIDARLRAQAQALADKHGMTMPLEQTGPVTFIGSGENLNEATQNGLRRAAQVTGLRVAEIQNRATITGSIEIGRLPGVVKVGFLCPMHILERIGIAHLVRQQYGLGEEAT